MGTGEVKVGSSRGRKAAGIAGPLIGRPRLTLSEHPHLFFPLDIALRTFLGSSRGAISSFALEFHSTTSPVHLPKSRIGPSFTMASNISSAGITTDSSTGERYIPSSVRADGSKRREIKVRPGYKPPEDVELYRNRAAAAWKTRGKGGVPGAEAPSSEEDKSAQTDAMAASNKNAKRREAKRKAKEAEATTEAATEKKGADSDNWRAGTTKKEEPKDEPKEEPVDPEAEKEKKVRNLKKKLRQAHELREKKLRGETLLPEQFEKVIKIQELIRQLDVLGFDQNGENKQHV